MPTYSPRKGVTTGVGHKNGKVYIKMVDENHPDGYTETKVMAEEGYKSEDGDIVIVGYANPLRTLAVEAYHASLRYIEKEIMPYNKVGGHLWENIDPEWERETIQRLGRLIMDELDRNPDIPEYITKKLSNQ